MDPTSDLIKMQARASLATLRTHPSPRHAHMRTYPRAATAPAAAAGAPAPHCRCCWALRFIINCTSMRASHVANTVPSAAALRRRRARISPHLRAQATLWSVPRHPETDILEVMCNISSVKSAKVLCSPVTMSLSSFAIIVLITLGARARLTSSYRLIAVSRVSCVYYATRPYALAGTITACAASESAGAHRAAHGQQGHDVHRPVLLVSAIQKGTRVLISLWDSLMFGRVPTNTAAFLSTRPNISESHSEISTRVPFCIAAGHINVQGSFIGKKERPKASTPCLAAFATTPPYTFNEPRRAFGAYNNISEHPLGTRMVWPLKTRVCNKLSLRWMRTCAGQGTQGGGRARHGQ